MVLTEEKVQYVFDTSHTDVAITSFAGARIISAKVLQEKTTQYPEARTEPCLDMYFSLEGDSAAWDNVSGKHYAVDNLHHGMMYTPAFDGHYTLAGTSAAGFCIEMDQHYMQRMMVTDLDCLQRFWDKAAAGKAADLSSVALPLTWQQQQVITDIHQCRYSGHMKLLYLESKIMELFLLQATQAEQLAGRKAAPLHPSDKERLYAARDFVKAHMFEPITLMQVARHCGLNDFKLKKGFKALFGTTVFGYLNELKMSYGRQMLLESNCTVAEVGYVLGYTDSYNFSKSFKKYFGYPPGKLKAKH
ncbi:helix-turn-helix transcriptional regulator [Chitinophaga japonensis]|uniref:AraC-like DNA-binding protein n=1 Tax=Chitinophaga japonensis TaxID=104662 RepID=A0A562TH38_CHIJA|nr:AraC family transcriptional regulator [Chitinophaga japonensis]TWI92150.1 AraC-like DNA-binding protein [Chitinophaga japonensis]